MSRRIFVISFSPLHRDPRVLRQLVSLENAGFELVVAGYSDPGIKGVEYWRVRPSWANPREKLLTGILWKAKAYQAAYNSLSSVQSLRRAWRGKGKPTFDLVIANDVEVLPVALEVAQGSPVFLDAHEYSPAEWSSWKFRFFFAGFKDWLCRNYLTQAAAMSTVCEGIALEYERNYGVRPFVMLNAPEYADQQPDDVDRRRIRLVHHGVAARERALEVMIEAMNLLDERYELDMYLMETPGVSAYLEELKRLASGGNVRFRKAVPFNHIIPMLNGYDIGLAVIPPNNFNYQMCLPNKFFEFVQGRLAVVTGPSPEMAKLVRQYDLGRVADNFSSHALADAIASMDVDEIRRCKANADAAARELCFESQEPKFLDAVRRLVSA